MSLITIPPSPLISVFSPESAGQEVGFQATNEGLVPVSANFTANLAVFFPFRLQSPATVLKLWWHNGAAVSGNVDCGIYSDAGSKIVSTGSTAQATINVIQEVDITDTVLNGPARYWCALALDNASGKIFASQSGSTAATKPLVAQMAAAFPLPATATFASDATQRFYLFGAAFRTQVA